MVATSSTRRASRGPTSRAPCPCCLGSPCRCRRRGARLRRSAPVVHFARPACPADRDPADRLLYESKLGSHDQRVPGGLKHISVTPDENVVLAASCIFTGSSLWKGRLPLPHTTG